MFPRLSVERLCDIEQILERLFILTDHREFRVIAKTVFETLPRLSGSRPSLNSLIVPQSATSLVSSDSRIFDLPGDATESIIHEAKSF